MSVHRFQPQPFFADKNRAFWNLQSVGWAGAFLLFGRDAVLPEAGDADIAVRRVQVGNGCKEEIIKQLNTLAINEGTAFRDIDRHAKHLASLD